MGERIKFDVVGIGGVGGFYGGMLTKPGVANVTLVGKEPSFSAIRQNGLILNRPSEILNTHPRIIKHISEIDHPDVVILTVKSYDLE